ncbi:hypothetical protein Drorol1_Dr00010767 [Drosera rotundifolia]
MRSRAVAAWWRKNRARWSGEDEESEAIDFLDKFLLYGHQDRLTAKEAMGFENGERRGGETRGGNRGEGRFGWRRAAVWSAAERRSGEEKEKAEVNKLGDVERFGTLDLGRSKG